MQALVDLSDVVRRVVGARVRDADLVEDLTQETLVRVAAAERRLAPESLQAYAIVTARNLVISHARSGSVHERHAHRLVDYTTLAGPEQLTMEREETDALVEALQRLDDPERRLLMRHEADGVSVEALAADSGTSKGAVAMRLARARAALRVEFVLAFRRVDLPSQRCRAVLLALSAGDGRRQHVLDAAGHLLRCHACAALARPITERRRSIAAWLIVAAAEALRRAVGLLRRSRTAQAAVAATAGIAFGAILLSQPDRGGPSTAWAPTSVLTSSPATTSPPTIRSATTAPAATTASTSRAAAPTAPSSTPRPATVPATTVVAAAAPVSPPSACPAPAPVDQIDARSLVGCPFAPTTLTAIDVPADEGFWAQTSTGQVLWVQLDGTDESPVSITPEMSLVVLGTIGDPSAAGSYAADPRIANIGYILLVAYDDVLATS